MFKKNILSSMIKVAIATTMVTGLSGCLVEGDTSLSTTGGTFNTVSQPKGTVVGSVLDTNGNPLSGVTVYVAGQETVTDDGGMYRFDNVPATNTVGAEGAIVGLPLNVTVAAPTGYLGATVFVNPQSQMDGTSATETTTNPVVTYIDGYIAQAANAILPALNTTVSGVLRDTVSGQAIPNTEVRLDLETVTAAQLTSEPALVPGSYQTLTYSATTDASGNFVITNVPDDSELRFMVDGYNVDGVAFNSIDNNDVTTADEALVSVGNVTVTAMTALDAVNPFVTSVTGVVDQAANPGLLNDDIDGSAGIVINFSETIDAANVDANSVIVWDDVNGYQTGATVSMAADGLSMTITTAAAISAGATVEIYLLTADFQDTAANILTAGTGVGYDADVASATTAAYVQLTLQVFTETNLNATAVSMIQETSDTTGIDDFALVQASSSAFNDVVDEGGVGNFQQLNSADDDDTFAGPDAAQRLSALATQLGAGNVIGNVARVTFTPTNATYYDWQAVDAAGNTIAPVIAGSANVVAYLPVVNGFQVTDTNDVTFVVSNIQPGDVLMITPYDDFGKPGTTTSLTLADNVEPTTVLQNSYGVGPVESSVVTSYDFGDGGQLTSVGAQTIGTPYLNVTPQLLDNLDANGDDTSTLGAGNDDDTLLFELMASNSVDVTTGLPYITPAAAGPYDATAFAALNPARSLGVAMSEDITVTGTPAYSGGNASLSGWSAHNDVTVDDEGTAVNADLIDVDVNDVFALAADNNADINFAGAIADTAATPNTATAAANPRVVIRDAMPPMVTSAVYNGTDFVITFNEAVSVDTANDTVVVGGVTLGLTNSVLSNGNTVLTISPEDNSAGGATGAWIDDVVFANLDGFGDLDRGAVFNLAQYPEASVGYTLQGVTNTEGHAVLTFTGINDMYGNSWANDSAGITAPSFAVIDATGGFVSIAPAAPAATATAATLDYVFTHPLDVATVFGACVGAGTITENANDFTLDSTAVLNCFATSSAGWTSAGAVYDKATNTLSVDFDFTVTPLVSGDTITWLASGGNAVGEYDSVDITPVAVVTVP